MPAERGQTLSHYRLVEKIGEGGMGVVWKAEDTVLGRTVAVKVLPADHARDEKRRKMFFDEARLASSLSEAHIVQVHEFGREGDLDFIVMEYVEGKPLSKILHGRPLPLDKVASFGLQAARALSRAHRKGLLHRDIKPANMLVTTDGELKVVDFGLAALFQGRVTTAGSDELTRSVDSSVTAPPKRTPMVGTLPYMSPEQVRGEKLDARSDIFSLGTVLYEMTTGKRPFRGATNQDVAAQIVKSRPKPVHEVVPKVPLDLDRIITKALSSRRGDRYQNTEDLAVDLKRLGRDLDSDSSPTYDDLKRSSGAWKSLKMRIWPFIAVFLIGSTAWLMRGYWNTPIPHELKVLVLPMNVSGQAEGTFNLGRIFAEAISVKLTQANNLKVMLVPAIRDTIRNDPVAIDIANEMGADRVLTGSLTRESEAISARVRLLSAPSNQLLWGTEKNSETGNLQYLASMIAREIAQELDANFPVVYDIPVSYTFSKSISDSTLLSAAKSAIRRYDYESMLEFTEQLVEAYPDVFGAYLIRCDALVITFDARSGSTAT